MSKNPQNKKVNAQRLKSHLSFRGHNKKVLQKKEDLQARRDSNTIPSMGAMNQKK